MKNVDNYTRVMLTLLVIGIWGLLLRPMISVTPAQAQQPNPTTSPSPSPSAKVIKAAQIDVDQLNAQHSYLASAKASSISIGTLNDADQKFKVNASLDGSNGAVTADSGNFTTANATTGNFTDANITTGNVSLLHARVMYFDDINKNHRSAIFLDDKGNLLIRKYNRDNKPVGPDRLL